jgi:hypothetical protein
MDEIQATRRALFEAYNKRKSEARTIIQGSRDNGIRSLRALVRTSCTVSLAYQAC